MTRIQNNLIDLQQVFKKWCIKQGYSVVESNVLTNNAFFLIRTNLGVKLLDVLTGVVLIEPTCINLMYQYFLHSGSVEHATRKTNEYIDALRLLKSFYSLHLQDFNNNFFYGGNDEPALDFMHYCKSMKMTYSYKALLIMALLDEANVNGSSLLSSVAYYFINFYDLRIENGLVAEKKDSIFSKKGVSLNETMKNILNNAAKVLEKDGILIIKEKHLQFVDHIWAQVKHAKEKYKDICKSRLNDYYHKFDNDNNKDINISNLGIILHQMYHSAESKEKVLSVYIFGIKFASVIQNNNYSIRDILKEAGLPIAYQVEISKAIKLSKYVILRDEI